MIEDFSLSPQPSIGVLFNSGFFFHTRPSLISLQVGHAHAVDFS